MSTQTYESLVSDVAEAIKEGSEGPDAKAWGVGVDATTADAAKMAAALLSAYATTVNKDPSKAITVSKSAAPVQLTQPEEIADQKFWGAVLSIVSTVAPLIINAFNKDFQQAKTLSQVVQELPQQRRDDQAWTDFATQSLMYSGYQSLRALGAQPAVAIPQLNTPPSPPAGVTPDKAWWNDVIKFVGDAAPVVWPYVQRLFG